MTLNETYAIMSLLQYAYPSYYRGMSKKDATATARLWQQMFEDDSFDEVQGAVKILLATKIESYPPTIGAVKEKLAEFRGVAEMTAQEAWVLVSRAVRSVDWLAPEKQFNKLPPAAQKAVGSAAVLKEWGMSDEQAFETVIYSQFVKAYNVYQKREKEMAVIPSDVRDMLSAVAERMALTDGSENKGVSV